MLQNVDGESAEQMCHVTLPDGSEAWLQVSAGHTVGTLIEKLGSRVQHGLEFVDAVIADTNEVCPSVILL